MIDVDLSQFLFLLPTKQFVQSPFFIVMFLRASIRQFIIFSLNQFILTPTSIFFF